VQVYLAVEHFRDREAADSPRFADPTRHQAGHQFHLLAARNPKDRAAGALGQAGKGY
jgi:hypothetical protein